MQQRNDLCSFFSTKKRRFWYKYYYKASDFPMNMAWNYVMSLILLTFIFGLLTLLLAWQYTYELAWFFLQSKAFLSFLVTYLVNSFLIKTIFVKKYCINKDGIADRTAYSYWDLYNFVAKVYLGFITGLLRVIMGVVAAACTLVAVNVCCMPRWFPELLDAAYYSYMMMVWEYHTFNNPAMVRLATHDKYGNACNCGGLRVSGRLQLVKQASGGDAVLMFNNHPVSIDDQQDGKKNVYSLQAYIVSALCNLVAFWFRAILCRIGFV